MDQSLVPQEELPELRNIVEDGVVWWVVVDFVRVWTDSADPANYWRLMKKRADPELKAFMQEALRKYPFKAGDGRMHNIDTATEESLLRLVQSIPSKNAERVKRALAHWGAEKLQELRQGPSPIEIEREKYRRQGYDAAWIDARIGELLARNEITETWKIRGAEEGDYAILTNTLTEGTFGLKVKAYKVYKHISPNTNLQDNMTLQELGFSIISKATAMNFHERRDSQGTPELLRDVTDAGQITGQARALLERETGQSVISSQNAKDLKQLPDKKRKRESLPEQKPLL
jgi:hypothetical protein